MQLTAGLIQLQYENGFLRTLTANGEEVLRMIYIAFRNRDWNTARIVITNENVKSESDSFEIAYDWQVNDLGIQMIGTVHIEGQPDGTIAFDFYGKAVNTFFRNRIGFCVLHPIEGVAGQPCVIESPDGHRTESAFPDLIRPHQPFLNIQAMTWQMASGQRFTVAFHGDIFETEDQRNWTDASYKTYSTPLSRPLPAEVLTGTEIRQRVQFQPVVLRPERPSATSAAVSFDVNPSVRPRIGLGHQVDGPPLSEREANALKTLNLSHLRANVRFTESDWQGKLSVAQQDANRLNVPLELALFFGPNATTEAEQFVQFVHDNSLHIYSLSLFQADNWRTTDTLLGQVVPIFRQQLPDVKLGGGTDANFVDLNRYRFDFSQVDFVTYSVNPQVHAVDDQTLMENAAGQADTVRSARALSGGKPVHVSPVTLLPRFNPDAQSGTGPTAPPADPRHATEFGAEWTRQSLATLTQAGAASVTYYETHGPRGLVDGETVFPVLEVFRPS